MTKHEKEVVDCRFVQSGKHPGVRSEKQRREYERQTGRILAPNEPAPRGSFTYYDGECLKKLCDKDNKLACDKLEAIKVDVRTQTITNN